MSRLTRDGTVEPLTRPNSQARTRTGNYSFSLFSDHVQDWQPYPIDPNSCCMCDHTCRRPDSHTQLPKTVCVCVFFPSILDIKFVGRTSRGHTGGRSHRIFNPPSFCGACLVSEILLYQLYIIIDIYIDIYFRCRVFTSIFWYVFLRIVFFHM